MAERVGVSGREVDKVEESGRVVDRYEENRRGCGGDAKR